MPVTVRGASGADMSKNVVPYPTGYAAGDLIVIMWSMGYGNITMTAPTGWNTVRDAGVAGSRSAGYVWKVITAGDGSSVTLTPSTSSDFTFMSFALYGFDPARPLEPASGPTTIISHGNVASATPSITPQRTGSRLLWMGFGADSSSQSATWSTGFRGQRYNGAGDNFTTAYADTEAVSGANTNTFTQGTGSYTTVTAVVEVLEPANRTHQMMM